MTVAGVNQDLHYVHAVRAEAIADDDWRIATARELQEIEKPPHEWTPPSRIGIWSMFARVTMGKEEPYSNTERHRLSHFPKFKRLEEEDARWLAYAMWRRVRSSSESGSDVLMILPDEESGAYAIGRALRDDLDVAVAFTDPDLLRKESRLDSEASSLVRDFASRTIVVCDESSMGGHTMKCLHDAVQAVRGRPPDLELVAVAAVQDSRPLLSAVYSWTPYLLEKAMTESILEHLSAMPSDVRLHVMELVIDRLLTQEPNARPAIEAILENLSSREDQSRLLRGLKARPAQPTQVERSPNDALDVLLVAIKPTERDALLAAFARDGVGEPRVLGRSGICAWVFEAFGLNLAITVIGTAGNVQAAEFMRSFHAQMPFRCAVLIGMCAGVRDEVELGHVIVGEQVHEYEYVTMRKTGPIYEPRSESPRELEFSSIMNVDAFEPTLWQRVNRGVLEREEAIGGGISGNWSDQ